MTIFDLLTEMQSFTHVDEVVLKAAKKSKVSDKNSNYPNNEFQEMVTDWKDGRYDEDPELLVQNLERLIM